MIRFTIGQCNIQTNLQSLKKFSNDVYYRYNNSQRGKKKSISDDKFPHVKVTGDIFSMQVWVKSEDGEEQRLFLDGDVFLNTAVIHTITLEGKKFSEEIFREMKKVIQSITKIGKGYCYAEINKVPTRFENGKFFDYPVLIDELYNSLSDEQKEINQILYEALQDGFDKDEDDFN